MIFSESAVDVPNVAAVAASTEENKIEAESAASSQAPMAKPENYDEQNAAQPAVEEITAVTSAPVQSASVKLNGSAVAVEAGNLSAPVTTDPDTSFDTSTYQPNQTFYDDEDEEDSQPKRSLEEEIQQLDANYTEQNHVTSATAPTASPTTPVATRRKGGCGACGAVVGSVVMAVGIVGILFYVLYFSGLDHPYLSEARRHLTFLEPTRDFVATQAQAARQYFTK